MSTMRKAGVVLLQCFSTCSSVASAQNEPMAPSVSLANGTYTGRYEPSYGTDYFLGMPFAQPPVGDLRFRVPQPLNSTWEGSKNATEFGPECIGYGLDTESQGNYVSEDCLTVNVVRSRGAGDNLPVVIWIHGGGLRMGGAADHRYNQSFIVQQSALAGMPIVAVSINYRLSAWGFLYGSAIQESGNTMLGFRDQRLALQWVQENIVAFGGDPSRVTIQGQSSGSTSVGAQLIAYNGRDDGLFAGAIQESGYTTSLGPYPATQAWDKVIANISDGVGCSNSSDVLTCLREVPVEQLNAVINSTATSGASYGLVVDGDFITDHATKLLEQGNFVHVPLLLGSNTDEGAGSGQPVNTTQEFLSWMQRSQSIDNATAQDMAILYPDIPAIGIPETLHGRPNSTIGLQFKRSSAVAGDIGQHAPRRLNTQLWTANNATAYSYRFNVLVNGFPYTAGSVHFQEIAFVFYNLQGLGYPQNLLPNPLGGVERPKYLELAQLMVRMWISFINYGDPNMHLGVAAEHWPAYTLDNPQNFAFEQNVTSHSEPDCYRAEGINYISELIMARAGRNCSGLVACGASDTG